MLKAPNDPFLHTVRMVGIVVKVWSAENWFVIYGYLEPILCASLSIHPRSLIIIFFLRCEPDRFIEFQWPNSICRASWCGQCRKMLSTHPSRTLCFRDAVPKDIFPQVLHVYFYHNRPVRCDKNKKMRTILRKNPYTRNSDKKNSRLIQGFIRLFILLFCVYYCENYTV